MTTGEFGEVNPSLVQERLDRLSKSVANKISAARAVVMLPGIAGGLARAITGYSSREEARQNLIDLLAVEEAIVIPLDLLADSIKEQAPEYLDGNTAGVKIGYDIPRITRTGKDRSSHDLCLEFNEDGSIVF